MHATFMQAIELHSIQCKKLIHRKLAQESMREMPKKPEDINLHVCHVVTITPGYAMCQMGILWIDTLGFKTMRVLCPPLPLKYYGHRA